MAVHEPQIGPPPPSRRGDHSALAAPPDAAGLLGVPESEMSALVAAAHWSDGPLGDPQGWPQSLRTAVGICLASRFPILLWWGPELVMIYNDAYRPMLGQSKHPRALGTPGREVWGEIWDVIGPMLDQVMAGGGATWSHDQLLVLDRNGYPEECYFTFSYSPITDEAGGVGGVFCAVTETTERVVGERRLATLAEMAALMGAPSRADVVRTAATIMGSNTADHPVVVVLDAPPEGQPGALATLVERQLPDQAPGTCARVADLVRQVSGTGRPVTVPADGEALAGGICAWHAYPVAASAGPLVAAEPPSSCSVSRCTAVGTAPSRPTRPCAPPTSRLPSATCGSWPRSVGDGRPSSSSTPPRARSSPTSATSCARRSPSSPVRSVRRSPSSTTRASASAWSSSSGTRTGWPAWSTPCSTSGASRPAVSRRGSRRSTSRSWPGDWRRASGPRSSGPVSTFEHDCGSGVLAHLDRDMVERIVLNLLTNAVKFTPGGSVGLRVRQVDDDVEIAVSDTGVGIHPDDVDRAFARFERLPAPDGARSHEGAGIGLAMVQQLAELMGGSVALTSEVGRGSTFTVRLPVRPAAAQAPAPPAPSSAMTPRGVDDFLREVQTWQRHPGSAPGAPLVVGPSSPNRARLVVAEDNEDLRTYLGQVLGEQYEIELVPDGAAALDAVRRETPDLVLADVMMPGLDGYGLVDAIRRDPALSGVPVVLLSARAGDDETSTALGAGADDYLVKPFSVLELRARVASNLERAGARTQDASWRRAVTDGLHDAMLILDLEGTVLEVNDRFGLMLGWREEDGPFSAPYPWDVDEVGTSAGFADAVDRAVALHDGPQSVETVLRHRDGRRVVGSVRVSVVEGGRRQPSLVLATVRDVTLEHEARERRATAARLAAELGAADELTDVVAAAVAGLSVLFTGDATVSVVVGRQEHVFTASGPLVPGDLDPAAARALDGDDTEPVGDGEVHGILLTAGDRDPRCRVWVAFPVPRPVTADERIAGDLLVQALALACDRVVAATTFAEREQHLRRAIESHEQIGQAVGILVERHRWTPTTAFERLKRSSQDHNTKLREVALRVIESGADPGDPTS